MIADVKIRKRLRGAIELLALSEDRRRVALYAADRLVEVTKRLIVEEVRQVKRKVAKRLDGA